MGRVVIPVFLIFDGEKHDPNAEEELHSKVSAAAVNHKFLSTLAGFDVHPVAVEVEEPSWHAELKSDK